MLRGRVIGVWGLCFGFAGAACGSATNGAKCGAGTKLVGDTCVSAGGSGGANSGSGGSNGGAGASTGGSSPSAGAGGIGTVSVCAGSLPVSTTDLTISDFEDGFTTGWGNFNDGTGTQLGTGTTGTTPDAELIPSGRGTSLYAAHSWGTGFTVWGAGIQRWYGPPCRDVSVVDGFAFWARGNVVLRVGALTPETQAAPSGDCTVGCFDAYGATIQLSDRWQFHAYRWEDLHQVGSGTAVPFSHRLLGLAFALAAPNPSDTTAFDYWIDDVTYFTGTTPIGSGGAGGGGAGGSAGAP